MISGQDAIEFIKEHQYGFITQAQVKDIARDPQTRLKLLLIRWQEGRALVPAQNVADLIDACSWTVRDVSVPA